MVNISEDYNAYVLTMRNHLTSEKRMADFHARANELGVTGFTVHYGMNGVFGKPPNWWGSRPKAYFCHMAHVTALYDSLARDNGKPTIILEDDAYLLDSFLPSTAEVLRYFEEAEESTVCYLGGKYSQKKSYRKFKSLDNRRNRHAVKWGDKILTRMRVGGGYAYAVAPRYAHTLLGYWMDDPFRAGEDTRGLGAIDYHNDTKMTARGYTDNMAIVQPPCVGHRGGMSVLSNRRKGSIHC